jgi:hypothetical protein
MSIGYFYEVYEDYNGSIYLAILNPKRQCVVFNNSYGNKNNNLINDLNQLYFANDWRHIFTTNTPHEKYRKIIKNDNAWLIATNTEILWDSMGPSGEFIFVRNKEKIQWEYDE